MRRALAVERNSRNDYTRLSDLTGAYYNQEGIILQGRWAEPVLASGKRLDYFVGPSTSTATSRRSTRLAWQTSM